jgi:hypothetical protein
MGHLGGGPVVANLLHFITFYVGIIIRGRIEDTPLMQTQRELTNSFKIYKISEILNSNFFELFILGETHYFGYL